MQNEEFLSDYDPKHAEQIARRVESERKKLTELIADVDAKKKKAAAPLVKNAAFMRVKLDELMQTLMSQTPIIPYDNGGGQKGIREHPGFTAYNKLFNSFSKCIKQLCDLLPSTAGAADELLAYLDETRQS